MLVGRDDELAQLEHLVTDAAAGNGRALIVRGDAGIGKSALLDALAAAVPDVRLVRGVGVESEAELAFGALHQLLYPHLNRLDALPELQADALRAAFGLTVTPAPNRFLIGAGTLALLSELAAESPVLCLVDDAQWFDQGSWDALVFAARRIAVDRVAMVFGVRESAVPFPAAGLDTLRLTGLSRTAAAELLDRHVPGLSEPEGERVLQDASSNPLAVIELGSARKAAGRSDDVDPAEQVGPLPVARRVQERFHQQIEALPEATRLLLGVAAADGAAGLDTVLRVGRTLGVSPSDLEPAERALLVTAATDTLVFRHPLVRSAAYQFAGHGRRLAVHRAFADELTGTEHADRRAWHLAAATTEPDDAVAEELERAALRAEHRGGAMAVSVAFERAARLSTDRDVRARRIGRAARSAYDAGKVDRAARLATEAQALTTDVDVLADARHLQAELEYERTSSAADASLALEAAELVLDRDPARSALVITEVVVAARHALAHDVVRRSAGHLIDSCPPTDSQLRLPAEAQIGWMRHFDGDTAAAVPPIRALLRTAHGPMANMHRMVACFGGLMLGDDADVVAVAQRLLAESRASGALAWVPYALEPLSLAHLLRGEFFEAQACLAEGVPTAVELGMDTQASALRAISVWLAAVRGDEARCRATADEALPAARVRHPVDAAVATWGLGLLELGAGRPADALPVLEQACSTPARRDLLIRAVPDLVEAGVRGGQPDRVRHLLPELDTWAAHTGTPAAEALALRCRALRGDGEDTERGYVGAVTIQSRHGGPFDLARSQLVHGEWLRRRRRRTEAGAALTAAAETFRRLGAHAWADRAGDELGALGERPVARPDHENPRERLTPQELQVVRLAAAGHSNKEIAAQMFLSARTVGHHLYRAYPKLGVTRRAELARLAL